MLEDNGSYATLLSKNIYLSIESEIGPELINNTMQDAKLAWYKHLWNDKCNT
jgi:hypothetical protein